MPLRKNIVCCCRYVCKGSLNLEDSQRTAKTLYFVSLHNVTTFAIWLPFGWCAAHCFVVPGLWCWYDQINKKRLQPDNLVEKRQKTK